MTNFGYHRSKTSCVECVVYHRLVHRNYGQLPGNAGVDRLKTRTPRKYTMTDRKQRSRRMRRLEKKNFVLVAEIASRRVRAIVEGKDERALRGERLDKADAAILKRTSELDQQFSPDSYDVVITRASSLEDLKRSFPEFSGWEEVEPERIAIP